MAEPLSPYATFAERVQHLREEKQTSLQRAQEIIEHRDLTAAVHDIREIEDVRRVLLEMLGPEPRP